MYSNNFLKSFDENTSIKTIKYNYWLSKYFRTITKKYYKEIQDIFNKLICNINNNDLCEFILNKFIIIFDESILLSLIKQNNVYIIEKMSKNFTFEQINYLFKRSCYYNAVDIITKIRQLKLNIDKETIINEIEKSSSKKDKKELFKLLYSFNPFNQLNKLTSLQKIIKNICIVDDLDLIKEIDIDYKIIDFYHHYNEDEYFNPNHNEHSIMDILCLNKRENIIKYFMSINVIDINIFKEYSKNKYPNFYEIISNYSSTL